MRTRTSGEAHVASPALGWNARIGIGAAALVARGTHLWQIHDATFYTVLVGDAKAYDRWALQISGGDWLGSGVFYQAPLYPYLLAAFYRLFGHDLTLIRLAQSAGGAIACVLLAVAVTRFLDRPAGIAAGLFLALYPPAIFFDGIIQKSALDALLICLLLWITSRVAKPPSPGVACPSSWFWLGVALGALALTRENAMVLAPILLVWLARSQDFAGQRGRHATAFVVGMSLLIVPVLLRNATVGGGFYLTTAQAGPNLYIGNNPAAGGMYRPLRAGRGTAEFEQADATAIAQSESGRALTPGEVSSYWMRRAGAFIVTSPGQWTALMGKKALLLFNAIELADTEALEQQAERSTLLQFGRVFNFGILLPLAVIGAWYWRGRVRDRRLLLAMSGAYAASVLIFYVSARYRYPLVPFVAIFAAAGVTSLARALSVGPWGPRLALGATVAAVAAVANKPLLSRDSMRATSELNLGAELQAAGRLDEAMQSYRTVISLQPAEPDGYINLGTALHAQGRMIDAQAQLATATAVAPWSAEAHYFLAKTLLERGQTTEAIARLQTAVRLSPELSDARTSLGVALASQGHYSEAIEQFRIVAGRNPSSALARWNLGTALAANGQLEEAVVHLGEAVRLDPANTGAAGDLAAAQELLAARGPHVTH